MNILQVNAPTNDKSEAEIEEFYNKVDDLMTLTRKGEITIVMGDLNAKIGTGAEGESVGAYGLGERNSRGDRLIQFCNENNLFVSNTFFKQHPRGLYTWVSPADNQGRIVRNQIGYIMMCLDLKIM